MRTFLSANCTVPRDAGSGERGVAGLDPLVCRPPGEQEPAGPPEHLLALLPHTGGEGGEVGGVTDLEDGLTAGEKSLLLPLPPPLLRHTGQPGLQVGHGVPQPRSGDWEDA